MEVKFNKTVCACLHELVSQSQNQEQTQEVRLPDGMPDIGRVLGCWGQVMIRSKEWRANTMSVSGGVVAWTLYMGEDGGGPWSVDTWIPFQLRWELPDTQRDGSICVHPRLKAVDARMTSARKLMVRANICVHGEAMELREDEIFSPVPAEPDVEVLNTSYPMELPREAGEKLFQVEEELILPSSCPKAEKILRYEFRPEIQEQKVMAGRLVFKGQGLLHLLYSAPDGSLCVWDTQIPFSQYADLDQDYGSSATAWVVPMLTGLELTKGPEDQLQLKAGVGAQYVIYDRSMIELVQDAYSPFREVGMQTRELRLPVRLDARQEPVRLEQSIHGDVRKALDVCWLPEHPSCCQEEETAVVTVPGQLQVLYYDENGELQGSVCRGEGHLEFPSDPSNRVAAKLRADGSISAAVSAEGVDISAEMMLETAVFTSRGLTMVTGLELGDAAEPDPGRPSLVLRRTGEQGLWELAKECGSTVDAICRANQLSGEPEKGRLLLIPVS